MRGIESRLSQVFLNLIANAVSFSPPGGEIRIRAREDGRAVLVTVEDDGPGIPDDKLTDDLRPLLHRAPGRREIRHPFRARPVDLEADRRGASRPHLGREPHDATGAVCGARFLIRLPEA